MQHYELTPLLLMREELQPKPSRSTTLYVQQSRTTIVQSPLYNKAIQMFYSDTPTYLPSPRTPPLIARPQVLPTPPQTIRRAGPSESRKLEHLTLFNDASDYSDESSATPPLSILPVPKAIDAEQRHVNPSYESSATPPPFILPDPNAIDAAQQHANPYYQLDPDSSDETDLSDETAAEDPQHEIEAEVIEIDSNSDQETRTSQVTVPFLIVVWTMVCLHS